MKRALEIALRGAFQAVPNPSVGCVIVYQDRIIGEGFTSSYGGEHAEINALQSVRPEDKKLLCFSSVYVTLEPCAHYGKTPPCAIGLVNEKVKTVFIGVLDPNPKVSGKGVSLLVEAGITTHIGILEKECRHHHRHFLKSTLSKRSYVTLKWAESADGYVAPPSVALEQQNITWISNTWSQQFAHKLRAQHAAILIGSRTYFIDQPNLTNRQWAGKSPYRFIITRDADRFISLSRNSLQDFGILEISATQQQSALQAKNNSTNIIRAKNLYKALEQLYSAGFQSLLIEGGSNTLQSFIDSKAWDEAVVFKSSKNLYQGTKSPQLSDLKPLGMSDSDAVWHALNASS
jgi:diaminohydroxyphosphoribosylaminopyrimidine deaminase/5-amino-6-(5-phosphoribosylamino)uracil reductase